MEPILPMVAPLLSDNTYRGLCGGVINLARVRQILTRLTRGNRMNIILLDRNRKVAATTRPDLQVMEAFRRPPGSVAAISGADAYHWVPMAEPGSSIMKRWGRSYLFKERRVSPELDWIIIVQGSVAPILDALTQQSILTLLISNLLIFFSVMLSYFISRSLTRRLKEFQAVTNTLPLHLSNVSRIDWPTSKIDEVHQLIDNFRQMALALGDSFRSKSILNQRLNEAQRISRVGSWELDLSTGTLSCSDEIYRIFELDRRRAISHEHLLERVHPEDRSMVRQAHTRAIQNKGGFESTHRLLMDDGRVKTVHKRSEIFTGDDGALQRYLATIHDITEIREAEEALRASEEKFRILFERAADAIFIHDPSGRMLAVNQTACERLGYTHRELLTKSMPEVESAEWAKLFSARIEYLDRCGQGVFESAHATRGGQSIPVELHCRKMVYEKIPAIMTMARDITIRKQDEETILSSLREKEILLREIHHRVKNNLQIVSSLFSLQANKSTDQRVTQALLESRQRIHAMAMIHETLYMGSSLAAIELPVYLQKLIDHLREVFSGQAGIRTIVDAQNIAMNVDQAVACGLIINELITNSLKYAFPGTDEGLVRVTVHPREDGQTMEMVVSDNGVGLPEGLDLSSIPSLGLQLVRGLVEHQLAGSLDVQTNGGTTFTIQWRLPDSNEAPS